MESHAIQSKSSLDEAMTFHCGISNSVKDELLQIWPYLPLYIQDQFKLFSEILCSFIERIIRNTDAALLSFLQIPEFDDDKLNRLMDKLLDSFMMEIEELNSIRWEPLIFKLSRQYQEWTNLNPLDKERNNAG